MKRIFSYFLKNLFSFFPIIILDQLEKILIFLKYLIVGSKKKKKIKSIINFQDQNLILNLKENNSQAYDVYWPLNKKKNIIYELPLLSVILEILKKENFKNFLDLGSFMGYYSCLLGKMFKEKINIYAIESNAEYCKFIKKNIKENSLINVKLINAVLSDKVESLFIDNESVHSNSNGKNLTKIQSIRLDDLCDQYNIIPEIIKLDVHGFEGKVLNGLKKKLQNIVKVILLELHSNDFLKKFSHSNKKNIISSLISNGFNCYIIPYNQKLNLYKVTEDFLISKFKNSYRSINENNYHDIFFDKEDKDNLVIALNKDLSIDNYECFYHNQSS